MFDEFNIRSLNGHTYDSAALIAFVVFVVIVLCIVLWPVGWRKRLKSNRE